MKEFETLTTRLKQEGQDIEALAETRLGTLQLDAKIQSCIHAPKRHQNVRWAMVASMMGVVSLVWFQSVQEEQSTAPIPEHQLAADLRVLSQTIEAGINEPLQSEQAAIIADLKALKKQWLSI